MKSVIFALAAGMVFCTLAHTLSEETKERGRINREAILREYGGFIGDKRNAVGSIGVVDAQTKLDSASIKRMAARLEGNLMMAFNYIKFEKAVTFSNLEEAKGKGKGNIWVVLTENDQLPNIVSLPEQRSVIVNVTALSADKPEQKKLESRVAKELARAVCFAFVIKYSGKPGGVMDPITTLKELDGILVDQIGVESKPHIERSGMTNFNIKRFPRKTYYEACQEGWAPPPANEIQKKVWEKAHEIPTKPLKIEFDPKTDTK